MLFKCENLICTKLNVDLRGRWPSAARESQVAELVGGLRCGIKNVDDRFMSHVSILAQYLPRGGFPGSELMSNYSQKLIRVYEIKLHEEVPARYPWIVKQHSRPA